MPSFRRLRKWRIVVAGLVGVFVLVKVVDWIFWLRLPPDIREYSAVRADWDSTQPPIKQAKKEDFARRCLEIARRYPGSVGGLSAFMLAAVNPDTSAGREVREEFGRQVETADVDRLAQAFEWNMGGWESLKPFAPAILARARQSLEHPRAGRLLAAVCTITDARTRDGTEPSPLYTEAADLIADRCADSPEIGHFCEGLGFLSHGSQPWAPRFERHLRAILKANRDRSVRCRAQFALASVVQNAPEDRQEEAEALFEEYCAEFDGEYAYSFQGIEKTLYMLAQTQLKELRFRAVGRPAPDITGLDLDSRPLKLTDYRGRVVLLTFWGTWCFPCMKLIPHERELVARFQGEPFEIVGVNCDRDVDKARAAVLRTGMTWRSFRDHTEEKRAAITGEWKVIGYPTLYLIDHHGIIRKRWIGGPAPEELTRMTAVLIGAARRKIRLEEMPAVVSAMRTHVAPKAVVGLPPAETRSTPDTGFLDKVFREADGSDAKYIVFVPRDYTGVKAWPAIVYLHGSGRRGTDGRSQTESGLAKAIREKQESFPFLVIFPQAREDENWRPGSAGARRAIAILEQVQTEYHIDPDRITLTGVSMGGEGTWSLAAADPDRWSAIVPICHGWKPDQAARLKDVPCWCFHGDADEMIPPSQSREMIRAIQEAGGKPLYQEFAGIDHNHSADQAYAMPELFEWLLLQNRARR
jgi:poly(3-hydroxybutyrate) depolymerase/thiol-disulfide isomerase/thioredoxin